MSIVDKPVGKLFANCEAACHFHFVGKLSRIHPQATQRFAQTLICLVMI